MGIMQKEIRTHKISIAIIKSVVLMSFMIVISGIVGGFKLNNIKFSNISNPVLIVATIIAIFIIINNCRTSYKYSVVSDRLIIHKIDAKKQIVLENLKVSNILYIGRERKEISKLGVKISKKYMCSLFDSNKYCCVYTKDGVNKKFYFQPSDEFINKINNLKLSIDRHS